jgi:hypothetical protein
MKKFLFPISMFFAGLIIGVGVMFIVMQKGPTQVVNQQWHEAVEMNVVYATLLHDQKYMDLKRLLETDMVASFDGLEQLGFADEDQSSARLVCGYYDLTGSNPPQQIDHYLSGVKGTDVRRLSSAMTVHSN